jgi:exo-beta-1,3-glucanase (GH17 family)
MATLTLISQSILLLSLLFTFAEAGSIGINYGQVANDLPPPSKVVELLKSQGIDRVKLYDTDSDVLTALANSGISVVVALPNELLSSTAADQSFADKWVQANISQYYPNTKIEAIAVGNEVFVDPNNTTKFLVPAMKNIQTSLAKYNLNSSIKISSPIALSALQSSYPSSSGSFKTELIEPVIKPMLDFLRQTGSYLMVNAYPFFAYEDNSNSISLAYALFQTTPGTVDSGNGLRYTSLFDAQLDAVFAAMNALGYNDVKVVVSETGWPSKGDETETGAGQANAAAYNGNLVRRVLTGSGTPLRPQDPLNVFLFALFNENQKTGPTSERNYGLFYPNEEKVYDIPLTTAELNVGQSTPSNGSKAQLAPAPTGETPAPTVETPAPTGEVSSSSVGQTWCVANGNAGEEKLQTALDYACGQGGADCRPIQEGATCYNPNTLEAHASYAFNSYYQMKTRVTGSCDFGGAAYVVTQPPKFGQCEFPTGY